MSIENFLGDYVQKFVDEYSLHEYLRRFCVTPDTSDVLGVYNLKDKVLTINYGSIVEHVNNNYGLIKNLSINEYLTYTLFGVLYHELRHSYQRKQINDGGDYGDLISYTWPSRDEVETGYYLENHGLYPSERDAQLYSFSVLCNLLEPKFNNLIVNEEVSTIQEGYNFNNGDYPMRELSNRKNMILKYELFNFNLYEKLIYGFPLNKEELEIVREALITSKKDNILVKKIVNK